MGTRAKLSGRRQAEATVVGSELEAAPADRTVWLVPVGAAAVVLMVGALVLLVGRTDGTEPVVAGPGGGAAGPLPRLIADPVPDGMQVEIASDQRDRELAPGLAGRVSLYGDPEATDPFAAGDLAVMVLVAPIEEHEPDLNSTDAREVEVRGGTGWVREEDPTRTVGWREGEDTTVELTSRSMETTDLLAVAEALDVTDPAEPADELPGGLRLVATTPMAELHGEMALVAYGGSDAGLSLNVLRAPEAFVTYIRWMQADAPDDVEVRGRAGALWHTRYDDAPSAGAGNVMLVWAESPDVMVNMSAWGLDADEVLAIAETLRPATDEEWDELRGDAGSFDRPPAETIVTASSDDGVRWWLEVDPGGSGAAMCLHVAGDRDGFTSCVGHASDLAPGASGLGPGQPTVASTALDFAGGAGGVVFGWVDPGAAGVEVHGAGHPAEPADLHEVAGVDQRFFAHWWPELGEVTVVTLDADGNELGRATVHVEQEVHSGG